MTFAHNLNLENRKNSLTPQNLKRETGSIKLAMHFPKSACSGFKNMGWALPLYLPCYIFKSAILNYFILFHFHEMRVG